MKDTRLKMQGDLESIEFYFMGKNLLLRDVNFVSEQGTQDVTKSS